MMQDVHHYLPAINFLIQATLLCIAADRFVVVAGRDLARDVYSSLIAHSKHFTVSCLFLSVTFFSGPFFDLNFNSVVAICL